MLVHQNMFAMHSFATLRKRILGRQNKMTSSTETFIDKSARTSADSVESASAVHGGSTFQGL